MQQCSGKDDTLVSVDDEEEEEDDDDNFDWKLDFVRKSNHVQSEGRTFSAMRSESDVPELQNRFIYKSHFLVLSLQPTTTLRDVRTRTRTSK